VDLQLLDGFRLGRRGRGLGLALGLGLGLGLEAVLRIDVFGRLIDFIQIGFEGLLRERLESSLALDCLG
jgi:hypothetical protein